MQKLSKLHARLLVIDAIIQSILLILPVIVVASFAIFFTSYSGTNIPSFFIFLPVFLVVASIVILSIWQFLSIMVFNALLFKDKSKSYTSFAPEAYQPILKYQKTRHQQLLFCKIYITMISGAVMLFFSPFWDLYLVTFPLLLVLAPMTIFNFVCTIRSYKLFKKLSKTPTSSIDLER